MEIKLDYNKSIFKNIEDLYQRLKKIRSKKEGALKKIEDVKKKMKKEKKESFVERKREWYERFYWFFTSNGKLAIGGRNKEQNEVLFKEYFEDNDLFFHADIIGGSVVILKNGKEAEEQELIETAQFAVCYSKAWKEGYSRLSAYCVEKEGVKKTHLGKKAELGSFFIVGERRWFKNLLLSLRMGKEEKVVVVPSFSKKEFKEWVDLKPGKFKKEVVAKEISKLLKVSKEDVLNLLPPGRSEFRFRKRKG